MKNSYDIVIAGTGIAGLYAALNTDDKYSVLLISKRSLTLNNSSLAQGGVAAVVDVEHDSFEIHESDTMIAGGHINDPETVKFVVEHGPESVLYLFNGLGVHFDKNADGTPQLTLEGGHSRRRILHHKDSTGQEMVNRLIYHVRQKKNVEILEDAMLFNIEHADNGMFLKFLILGKIVTVAARYVILATGGVGRVYQYTTNSAIATGDGIAIAHRMGAEIKDLSRIQFHPTAFAADTGRERFLISEAVRGEGAYLLNGRGERFMTRYDERGELAPRDVVSRSIMQEARRINNPRFYLDITHKDSAFLTNHFPMIYKRCLEEGIDMTRDKIPVFPCHHYLMGGIAADLDGKTSVDRLYAAGECACTGLHGANRLASNSLLEALVFGKRCAQSINELLKHDRNAVSGTPSKDNFYGLSMPHGFRHQIRDIMQSAYFVNPDPIAIREGLIRINKIYDILRYGTYLICPEYIEALSLVTVAKIILSEAADIYKREDTE